MLNIPEKFLQPPLKSESEVTVFGADYGECIVCHLGNSHWFIVDSCKFSPKSRPAAIDYLSSLGVATATAVDFIVVSHFDEDHIKGLAETIASCGSAPVYSSAAMTEREFMAYAIDPNFPTARRGYADAREIIDASSYLVSQCRSFEGVVPMTQLKRISASESGHGFEVRAFALSPSQYEVQNSLRTFAKYAMRPGERIRAQIPIENRNQLSVVVWVDYGPIRVCLGADLEIGDNPKSGWSAIIANRTQLDGRADVFKIPHHGSRDAFSHAVWDDMLVANPAAVLAPWSLAGRRLPTRADIGRIKKKTNSAHTTTTSSGLIADTDFPPDVTRLMKATAKKLRRKPDPGAVRIRCNLSIPSLRPRIEYIAGSAGPL